MLRKLPQRCTTQAADARLGSFVWSAAWLRAAEPEAAASLGITLTDLMVRAGTAAYKACEHHFGSSTKHWVILVGSGNNGGDGYVIARLAKAAGRCVTVLAMPHSKALPVEAAEARRRWQEEAGGTVEEVNESTPLPADADLVVDGLLGTGITGAPRGLCAALIERANALPARRFAIDIPSGLDAETGAAPGACFRADQTITFITLKPGLLTGQARSCVGGLTYDTLGLDAWLNVSRNLSAASCKRLAAADAVKYFGSARPETAHKGTSGRVLLVGGARGFGGAILMAAEASLAVGAGLTRVLTDTAHVTPLLTRCPEAMYTAADTTRAVEPAELEAALSWADVVVVGPGLGQGRFGRGVLAAALPHVAEHPEKLLLLDADALNLLPDTLRQLQGQRGEGNEAVAPLSITDADGVCSRALVIPRSIMTPHPGEAARLLGVSVAEVEQDRFRAAQRLAAILGGTCVLKGPGSIVCAYAQTAAEGDGHDSDGQLFSANHCAIVDAGNAGMATGGMGDVLSGVIAGIAAQRLDGAAGGAFGAACAGALAHSVAADIAVEGRGTRGLRATELVPCVTEVVNARSCEAHV